MMDDAPTTNAGQNAINGYVVRDCAKISFVAKKPMMDALRENVAREVGRAVYTGDGVTLEFLTKPATGGAALVAAANAILAIPEIAQALALAADIVKVPTTISREP